MRFAGQRFRQSRMGAPNFRADNGSIGDFSAPASISGLAPSMNQMPEKTASSWTKTAEPTHGKAPVVMPEFNEPIFRA